MVRRLLRHATRSQPLLVLTPGAVRYILHTVLKMPPLAASWAKCPDFVVTLVSASSWGAVHLWPCQVNNSHSSPETIARVQIFYSWYIHSLILLSECIARCSRESLWRTWFCYIKWWPSGILSSFQQSTAIFAITTANQTITITYFTLSYPTIKPTVNMKLIFAVIALATTAFAAPSQEANMEKRWACNPATYSCTPNLAGWQVCDTSGNWVVSLLPSSFQETFTNAR